MPNHLKKILFLCACVVVASPAAVAQHGGKAGASYHPPIKIETSPTAFPLTGSTISVTGSVFNKTPGGPHPARLTLRVVPADASGNYPANGPDTSTPVEIGSQNWAHWSNATFTDVAVPSPAQKLAIIVKYQQWGAGLHNYFTPGGAENQGVAIYRKRCIPVNNKSLCHWVKQ